MPNQPMSVSPVIGFNDYGEEVITDLSVSTGRGSAVGRDGQVENWQFDYIEDSEGQVHHRFSEVELDSDREDQGIHFDESEYIGALMDANPELEAARLWASEHLPDELLEYYNERIDVADLDGLNEAVEWLLLQYAQRDEWEAIADEDSEDEDEDSGELTEEEHEMLVNAVEQLEQQEADPYVADDWQDQVDIANESGDVTYATVAAATAAFHSGEVTSEEAIEYCLQNCDLRDLARVYHHLTT